MVYAVERAEGREVKEAFASDGEPRPEDTDEVWADPNNKLHGNDALPLSCLSPSISLPFTTNQAAFLMRGVVLPILAQREAVSFLRDPQQQQQPGRTHHATTPRNALGWPVFDREGRLIAVAVALNHYRAGGDGEEAAEADADGDDDEGRRDAAAAAVVGGSGGRYAAFGAEEERTMVNLCSQVRGWRFAC